jgi:dTDP-4-dehydrorhamnose 3,5-epimerase
VYDVAVDIRKSSPTFWNWVGGEQTEDNHRQFSIPAVSPTALMVLSGTADFLYYRATDHCAAEYERCIVWNDPVIPI